MPDLYLQELLQHKARTTKNKFDFQIEKEIEAYLKTLVFEANPLQQLISPGMRRAKMKEELKAAAELDDLSHHLGPAFNSLLSEGKNYLEAEPFQSMCDDFSKISVNLNKIDFDASKDQNFQTMLHLKNETITSIFEIGLKKFEENQYATSLSIFILLTILLPENPTYWYAAALAADACKNYELAAQLYALTSELDSDAIAPWLFSIPCYLECNQHLKAQFAYEQALKISQIMPIEDSLQEVLDQLTLVLKR